MWNSVWSRRARPETETPVRPFTYLHRAPPGEFRSPPSWIAAVTGAVVAGTPGVTERGHALGQPGGNAFVAEPAAPIPLDPPPATPLSAGGEPLQPILSLPAPGGGPSRDP